MVAVNPEMSSGTVTVNDTMRLTETFKRKCHNPLDTSGRIKLD